MDTFNLIASTVYEGEFYSLMFFIALGIGIWGGIHDLKEMEEQRKGGGDESRGEIR